ncbi:MAG: DNA-binding response regulator [Planctomycetaceae bacterium]|jgi:FixJ family two-component response regulator|nr:DNA-binding response regulator [Planctomycetaceae bacterium]
MASESSTVFIVDGDCAAQASVQSLIAPMGVKAERFSSAEEFLQSCDGSQSGCLVTELRLPGMGGLELQKVLRARDMTLPTIVVTDCADVPAAVESMQLGAFTLLEKPWRDLVLWDQIQRALAVEAQLREARRRKLDQRSRIDSLTRQERQIMDMMAAGQPNKRISSQLDLSLRTVEARRKDIYRKIGARSIAELVRFVCEAERFPSSDGLLREVSSGLNCVCHAMQRNNRADDVKADNPSAADDGRGARR